MFKGACLLPLDTLQFVSPHGVSTMCREEYELRWRVEGLRNKCFFFFFCFLLFFSSLSNHGLNGCYWKCCVRLASVGVLMTLLHRLPNLADSQHVCSHGLRQKTSINCSCNTVTSPIKQSMFVCVCACVCVYMHTHTHVD